MDICPPKYECLQQKECGMLYNHCSPVRVVMNILWNSVSLTKLEYPQLLPSKIAII